MKTPEKCEICGENWEGAWTDKHGQAVCTTCGAPYQLKDDMLKEGKEAPLLLLNDEYKEHLKKYYNETGKRAPLGTYISSDYNGHPSFGEEIKQFKRWLDD